MDKMVYTSTDFDGQRSTDYTLLIKVGQAEDVLAILDEGARLKFLTVINPHQANQQATDLLNLPFGKVKIVAAEQNYVFIPADVFDASYLSIYSRYLPNEGLADPLVSSIDPLGVKFVYHMNRFGLGRYTTIFPHAAICPSIQSYLCGASDYIQEDESVLAIDKAESTVRVSFFDAGRFHYCNDFEVYETADLNYHLLTVLEHLNLADRYPQLLLSGDIEAGDPYYQCISKYSEAITLADTERLTGVSVPSDLQQGQHRFLSLFGLNVCG